MNVLIVPDKFKGTLTAHAAAALMAEGWRRVRPEDRLELLPMSDGGDGFGEVLAGLLEVEVETTPTVDAAHRPHEGRWWWHDHTQTAIVESAQVIGLALLPPRQYHPFDLDTFGLGRVVEAVRARGAQRLLIGIGGSATNDGGAGLARALGWKFCDAAGSFLEAWTQLDRLQNIIPPPATHSSCEVVVAVDVQNPLLGPAGASRIYGPQKGLRPEDMGTAEACLGRLAEVTERVLRMAGAASEPGTGAAGGLGFGLRCFLDARLESGFNVFARQARLEERIRAAGLVITGEGAIDASTLMGKGVGEVAALCRRHGVPCLGLAGTLMMPDDLKGSSGEFTRALGMVPHLTTPENARADPETWLPRLAAMAAELHDGLPPNRF